MAVAQKIDVSIVVPAYNEAAIIGSSLGRLASFVQAQRGTLGVCEVVVVAAGTDQTATIAQTYAGTFEYFTLVTPTTPGGKGSDVRLGFLNARGGIQLFLDADLSVPLAHVVPMVQTIRAGADVVIGRRNLARIHGNPLRALVSVATNWLTRAAILPRIHDTQCGFKGFTKAAAHTLFTLQRVNRWGFDIELLVHAREAGLHVTELPIPDWHEARVNELGGGGVSVAAVGTFIELLRICTTTYGRWLLRHAGLAPWVASIATFALAFASGSFSSIWFDEAYSAMLIHQPLPSLLHFTSVDVHPPLYYIILKGWAALFGNSEFALRGLSMACGALASAVGVRLVGYMFGARVALLAVPFAVCAPLLLRYDIEIRMYALASLICVAATYVLVRALNASHRRKIIWWGAYAVLVAAGMYTLYYTALIWIVHVIWCLYVTKPLPLRRIYKQPWLWSFGAAVLLFLPWMGTFLWQAANVQGGFWIGPVTIREVLNVITMALTYHPQWQLDPWASAATIAGIGIGLWFIITAFGHTTGAKRRYFVLLTLYAFLPVIILFVASLPPFRPVFLDRYFSHTLLGGYLLLGVAAALHRPFNFKVRLAAMALVAVLLTGVVSLHAQTNYNFNTLKQPSAKEVAAYIQSQATPNATIVADNWALYFEMVYYTASPNLRFYDKQGDVSATGGSAMLHGSPQVIADGSQLAASLVYYVYDKKEPAMEVPSTYARVDIYQIRDYKIATYKRQ